MDNVNQVVFCFKEGYNCSQAILSVYGPRFGLSREMALKIASAFGAGMCMAETCGAVTGAFMVIGLKHGQADAADKESKATTYELVGQFVNKFDSRNGSVVCKELLGCDISTPEGMKTAQQKDLFKSLCPKIVQDAAEILEEILA
ncbi:MAG TPA: C-GCAxxG-C-C family protein [Sedimentisphaerales bacterium]|nr:C-GCAxxG-C-C family protein [Sedimentisphaerales bacterium]